MDRPTHEELRDSILRNNTNATRKECGIMIAFSVGAWALLAIVVMALQVDWQAVIDFIAPTAKQAREVGASAIMERY